MPLFQNECETFHMKMSSAVSFSFKKSNFQKNGFAPRLTLKQRHERTWIWPINVNIMLQKCFLYCQKELQSLMVELKANDY